MKSIIKIIVIVIFSGIYIIFLINRIIYVIREYKLDKEKIEKDKKMEIGGIKAIYARNAGLGYDSILDGNIKNKSEEYQYILDKRKNKFIYDLVNSVFICVKYFKFK